jgi:hypothetical protein
MPKALANRMMHLEIEVSFEAWKEWAIRSGIHPMVIGYLSFRQDALMNFDAAAEELAFATPRSWEMVSNVLKCVDQEVDQVYALIAGLVGVGVATEFRSWCKVYRNLPKISDIFAGRSISRSLGINKDNVDGMEKTLKVMEEDFTGLCFVNLVDFDMQYGHRRNIDGYAEAATVFDRQLGEFMAKMKDDDVLMITADHGCDPGAPGTDHTREYIPLLIYGKHVKEGVNLGTYPTFAMIGATISDMFDCDLKTKGESLLPRFIKD